MDETVEKAKVEIADPLGPHVCMKLGALETGSLEPRLLSLLRCVHSKAIGGDPRFKGSPE